MAPAPVIKAWTTQLTLGITDARSVLAEGQRTEGDGVVGHKVSAGLKYHFWFNWQVSNLIYCSHTAWPKPSPRVRWPSYAARRYGSSEVEATIEPMVTNLTLLTHAVVGVWPLLMCVYLLAGAAAPDSSRNA